MEDQLINFETAKLAKEKGFDNREQFFYLTKDKVARYYKLSGITNSEFIEESNKNFAVAPTQSLLQKWLRENHDLHIAVTVVTDNGTDIYQGIISGDRFSNEEDEIDGEGETYEICLEKCLVYCLGLV